MAEYAQKTYWGVLNCFDDPTLTWFNSGASNEDPKSVRQSGDRETERWSCSESAQQFQIADVSVVSLALNLMNKYIKQKQLPLPTAIAYY